LFWRIRAGDRLDAGAFIILKITLLLLLHALAASAFQFLVWKVDFRMYDWCQVIGASGQMPGDWC